MGYNMTLRVVYTSDDRTRKFNLYYIIIIKTTHFNLQYSINETILSVPYRFITSYLIINYAQITKQNTKLTLKILNKNLNFLLCMWLMNAFV